MEVDYKMLSAILGALLAVSEALGMTKKIQDNAIAQVIFRAVSGIFGGGK